MSVWLNFERELGKVSIIRRIENGKFDQDDYLSLLLNLRQQVIEGSRWITRCASSFNREYADVRSIVIGHAQEEHRDYEMLEKDYVSAGGQIEEIQHGHRNIGSEALHAFLMYRASQSNPIDLIGAMWIIEGLGQKMATSWAEKINDSIGGDRKCTKFMEYHGANDDNHMQKLYDMIDRVCTSELQEGEIVRTAKVVAKLYQLQLEEIK